MLAINNAASSVPECHRTRTRRSGSPIRHSREGGNPRTNIPRKKANRDITTYVHTATPLRLSGKNRPEPRYGAGIQGRWRGGTNDTQTLPGDGHPFFTPWCADASRDERLV